MIFGERFGEKKENFLTSSFNWNEKLAELLFNIDCYTDAVIAKRRMKESNLFTIKSVRGENRKHFQNIKSIFNVSLLISAEKTNRS